MSEHSLKMENPKGVSLEILWKKTENGARIDRVFGKEMSVRIPESIEGIPVTELGPYCFSSSERFSLSDGWITAIGEGEVRIEQPTMEQIAGKYLEEVILPDSLSSLDNAAFYNCRNMKSLSMGIHLTSMGSDVFTNCHKLRQIIIRGDSQEKSGLPLVLERIKTEVEARFYPQEDFCQSRVFFPEYYEWLDEVTSAHVFNRVIVGEGFRMRQCFQDRRLQFSKYDQSFVSSVKVEGNREVCQIAMNRLRWPLALHEDVLPVYRKAVEDRLDPMMEMIISHRDMAELTFLCESFEIGQETFTKWMEACIKADWTEANVYLMERKHKGSSFADKSFDFDEFDDFDDL